MGIFNVISVGQGHGYGYQGPRGPAGVGFKLSPTGQFDINQRRLVNVAASVDPNDAVIKKQLDDRIEAQNNPIGRWTGTGPVYGTINLGFDTTNAILYAIKVLCESKVKDYVFSETFWETKIIQQGIPISLHPYYDVVKNKHFACSILVRGNTLTMLTNDTSLPVKLLKVTAWAASGYLTDRIGPQGPTGPRGSGMIINSDGNYDAERKRIENLGSPSGVNDAVSLSYLDRIPGTALTRSIKAAGGLFTEGVPVDGLPLTQPTSQSSATSRKYVDGECNKLLPIDGSRSMTGNLNMNSHKVNNLISPVDNKDAANKEYVDSGDFYKQGHTVSEYNLHSRNFSNSDGRLSTFSFGVFKDFVKAYHTAPVHVALSLRASPCTVLVDLGARSHRYHSIRVEAFVDPTGDDGSLDLTIAASTEKYKPVPNVCITNTFFDRTTRLSIRITYQTNKEIALFLYGVPGRQYVSPFVVDNYPKLALDGTTQMTGDLNVGNHRLKNVANPTEDKDAVNKAWFERYIPIPRYRSYESLDRKKLIWVKLYQESNSNVDNLIGSGDIYTFTKTGLKSIEFCFPCLICLSGIQFNSVKNNIAIDTDWSMIYIDESVTTSRKVSMTITNYVKWTGQRMVATLNPRISTCFEIIFNNILQGTKIYSFNFTTSRGIYDSLDG